jgi:hypothetical protein
MSGWVTVRTCKIAMMFFVFVFALSLVVWSLVWRMGTDVPDEIHVFREDARSSFVFLSERQDAVFHAVQIVALSSIVAAIVASAIGTRISDRDNTSKN